MVILEDPLKGLLKGILKGILKSLLCRLSQVIFHTPCHHLLHHQPPASPVPLAASLPSSWAPARRQTKWTLYSLHRSRPARESASPRLSRAGPCRPPLPPRAPWYPPESLAELAPPVLLTSVAAPSSGLLARACGLAAGPPRSMAPRRLLAPARSSGSDRWQFRGAFVATLWQLW